MFLFGLNESELIICIAYSPVSKKLYHSRDVTFFEHQPYHPKPSIQEENVNEYQFWHDYDDHGNHNAWLENSIPMLSPDISLTEISLSNQPPQSPCPQNHPPQIVNNEFSVYTMRTRSERLVECREALTLDQES